MNPTNIVLLLSDQHSPRFLGTAGHPLVQTPNIDRLAARGTRFSRAYTPSPICVPARASLATGEFVHRNHYWDNAHAYDGRLPSWMHVARKSGVDCVSVGKLHYRSENDDTGFQRQILPMHIADGLGQVWGLIRDPLPVRPNGERLVGTAGPGMSRYNEYDLAVTREACRWLEARTSSQPFVLQVGWVAPHFPYVVPEEFFELYDQDSLERASPHPDDGWQPHPWVERFMGVVPGIDNNTDEERRRCTAAYLGLCSFMDAQVGQVLDVLEETGYAEDTLVIYASDHGDMVGRKGQWNKSMPYEDSAGIPMVIRGPGVASGRVCRTTTSLLDVYPTITEICGTAAADKPGRSLLEIAEQPDDELRCGFSEYHAYGAVSAWYMLRRGNYKLVEYVGFEPELFDLVADPDEAENLAGRPEYAETVAELLNVLHVIVPEPEAIDAQAKREQAARLAALGGPDKAFDQGNVGETPPPRV